MNTLTLLLAGCDTPLIDRSDVDGAAHGSTSAKWTVQNDEWYSLTLAGIHAGWMRVVREDDGQRYRSVNELMLKFSQGGANVDVGTFTEWIESHNGDAQQLMVGERHSKALANQSSQSAWELVRAGKVDTALQSVRTWQFDGQTAVKLVPSGNGHVKRVADGIPEKQWLPPAATERHIKRQIESGAKHIEYGSLQAGDILKQLTVRSALVGHTEFALNGGRIPASVWKTQTDSESAATFSHYAIDGKLLYSAVNLGVGLLETRRCDRQQALTGKIDDFDAADFPAINVNQPVTAKSRAVFELHSKTGKLQSLPIAGAQSVEVINDGAAAWVTVDLGKTTAATQVELAEAEIRDGVPVVPDNAEISMELAAESMRQTTALVARALAIASHSVVYQHFRVKAASGDAESRAESVGWSETRMLCDVLRVHRIATRVAFGLAYAEAKSAFEWRVWTQALIDNQWLDFDAASAEPFKPGHILVGFSAVGADGGGMNWEAAARRLADVNIKVIEQQ